jgi:two-component system, NarL family, nitrate/nitrite response regulator NarL
MPATRTVLLADDHPVVRMGVRHILESAPEFSVVGEAGDGRETLALVDELHPDVLLLDLAMPNLPGLEALRQLADRNATTATVILTGSIETRQILEALQLGARGIVLKDEVAGQLVGALRAVVAGQYWLDGQATPSLMVAVQSLAGDGGASSRAFGLTPREFDIMGAVVEGRTNRDIARTFSISEDTVKRHLTHIFDKTGVSSRLELAMFAVHHKLLPSA